MCDNIHRSSAKNCKIKNQTPFNHSRWKNRKERPNRSTNNGDMADKAKRDVISE